MRTTERKLYTCDHPYWYKSEISSKRHLVDSRALKSCKAEHENVTVRGRKKFGDLSISYNKKRPMMRY